MYFLENIILSCGKSYYLEALWPLEYQIGETLLQRFAPD